MRWRLSVVKSTGAGEPGVEGEISSREAYWCKLGIAIAFDGEVDVGCCDGEDEGMADDKEWWGVGSETHTSIWQVLHILLCNYREETMGASSISPTTPAIEGDEWRKAQRKQRRRCFSSDGSGSVMSQC